MEEEVFSQNQKKSIFRRFWWIGFIVVAIAIAGMLLDPFGKGDQSTNGQISNSEPTKKDFDTVKTDDKKEDSGQRAETNWPSPTAKYISAVPLDLTQIGAISKYRSCAGHDRAGYTFAKVLEANRSMKHYFYPISVYRGTIDKVKMFAPFDGTVSKLSLEKDKVGGRPRGGNGIDFRTPIDENAAFGFGHIYFVKDFKVGDTVKAGELIGYAALGDKGDDFDIDLKGAEYNSDGKEILDSAFDHMADSVLAEFAKYGITPENTKISKEARDTSPCDFGNQQDNRTGTSWVQLNQ